MKKSGKISTLALQVRTDKLEEMFQSINPDEIKQEEKWQIIKVGESLSKLNLFSKMSEA